MKENFLPAVKLTLACMIFFSGIYTMIIFGIAQFTGNKGKGEIIKKDKHTFYANIGQSFTEDKYFWSRPSAVNYNAAGSGGSNKGPSNPEHLSTVQARIDTFIAHNPGVNKIQIPSDIVTASGAGLDPHISVKAAIIQIKRIAKTRNINEGIIRQIVEKNIEKPLLGILGTEKINTLKLNLELDNLNK